MNFSPEEEKVVTVIVLFGGGLASVLFGGVIPAIRDVLLDFHVLVDTGIVIPVFGDGVGLDWARILIIGAALLLVFAGVVMAIVLRTRRRRRFNRIADVL